MLNSDIALVGSFFGIYTCTEGCGMVGNHWTNFSHIVASFHQWHSDAWGLLLTSDFVKMVLVPCSFSDYELHNGGRIQQIRSLVMWKDTGSTNKELGKFMSSVLLYIFNVSSKRNNKAKSLFQPFNPVATIGLWILACMVQNNFSLWISTLQS